MFTIELGICKERKDKISKSFSGTVYNCKVNKSTGIDIMNPVVVVLTDANLSNVNYAYIAEFSRYYYVTDISVGPDGLWQITLHEDVLMSNKDEILASKVQLARSADFRNYYLSDPRLPVTSKTLTWTRVFPNTPFDGQSHGAIVTVAGGES